MKSINVLLITISIYTLVFAIGCKKNAVMPSPSPITPTVSTKSLTNISSTSVVSGGEIISTINITDKGIIWGNDSSNLTVSNINALSSGPGSSSFTDTIQNLQPNTTYYLRAYAIYNPGVAYGEIIRFTTLPPQPSVYLTGYHGGSAAYWKNGKLFLLPNGTYAHSIYVVGSDIYVAGEDNGPTGHRAVYWKNGTPVYLTNGINSAVANSIFVVGSDIYVAGYELNNNSTNWPVAKYWKNGVAVPLTAGTTFNSGVLYSIAVVGNDVYAAGFSSSEIFGRHFATFWKNGIATPLSDSNNAISDAHSIFLDGNDIYVAGKEKPGLNLGGIPSAIYWKNGIKVPLTNGTQFAGANSVFVTAGDVYVAGYEYSGTTGYSVAKYWKNSMPFPLTNGTKFANAYSIYVLNNNVHIAGGEDDYFNAKYWKNAVSEPLEISATYSRSTSIFVK